GTDVVTGTAVPLGVVAVGSGNDVARDLGLPVHDVARSVDVIRRGLDPVDPHAGVRPVDAVAVSRPGGPAQSRYLAVLSCGIDAAVNERANTLSWPRGNARYVRALASELAGFTPYGYRVTADGWVWEGAATLVAVANTRTFGGGLRIAPDARTDDGLLDVVVADGLSRSAVLRLFPRLYRGSHLGHPAVHLRRARSVLVEPLGRHGRLPPPAMADGEDLEPLPLQCDVHPGAVGVLARTLGP
ncbi:diacylglycerol kinase family protein, partial [Georgenia sp. 10Sc9-8]|nr:diacylglycerol kinase family protein [Georgenia halotolerans]